QMNNRRKAMIVLGAGALAIHFASFAQQSAAKIARVGFLEATSAATITARIDAFRQGLRELGYVEGKNILIEYRYADGKFERLPGLAAELVRLNVDVIVTGGPTSIRPAREATDRIPIVMAFADPIAD